jgi:amino acid adenylation domain-containing protein/non-ribosomal peptide synthase protein (TIGR01720 family)
MKVEQPAERLRNLSPDQRQQLLLLLREREARKETAADGLRQSPEPGPYRLSFAQQRLWFLERLAPGAAAYNLAFALHLEGNLDVADLARALTEVTRRHLILRARFAERAGEPVLEIGALAPVQPALVDLARLRGYGGDGEASRQAMAEARRPFDLAAGPPLRTLLLRRGGRQHLLLLTVHHIVADGWSMANLSREVTALYAAFAAGRPSPLPELAVQYTDFAAWQRRRLGGELLRRHLAYWREQLAGAPAVLELPADRPRPAVQSFRGGTRALSLPPALTAALKRLAQESETTLFIALAAGVQVLLGRLSGQRDLVIGSPVANRTRPELEPLIGLFVNTLPLRADLSREQPFRRFLAGVAATTLAAFDHQELPFEMLVDALELPRSLSHNPLVQTLFALQTLPAEAGEPGRARLRVRLVPTATGTAQLDLNVALVETGGALGGGIQYNADLFDAATIDRWCGHLAALLAGVAADPQTRIGELPLLAAAERWQLAGEWNDTGRRYPGGGATLSELIRAQAARTPGAPAVVCAEASLSYGELEARALRLAAALRRQGVGPEEVVALCAERSLDLMVGLLGILFAGGAYLPLDPDYPGERLAWMLNDSGARVLLVQPHLAAALPRFDGTVVPLGGAGGGGEAGEAGDAYTMASPAPPPAPPLPEQLAYVIYTSGTMGRPKGVMNTHRGIVNRLLWMQDAYRLDAGERVLQKTPASFDVSVWELFWPLLTGAVVVMARPGGHRDTAYLVSLVAAAGVTTLHFVPSLLRAFLDEPELPRLRGRKLRLVASGEALPPELQDLVAERLGCPLHNLYGPTEAAVDVTAWDCRGAAAGRAVPIGRPIANLTIHVLERHGQLAPVGVPAELHIGGVGLARGYRGRPDLTAERFVPDAWGQAPGGRLYRTGDLVRRRPDGVLDYLGRLDLQVKIRGLRIELEEIEAVLARHPGVRQAAVAAREEGSTTRLVAYVVGRDGQRPPAAELEALLAASLPEFMVPRLFVELASLPLSPSGKLDRRALPAPSREDSPTAGAAPPRTPVEELLCSIWEQVLGRERIGIHDNFFALGGDSILSLRVLALAQSRGLQVALADLFRHQTVAALAALCGQLPDGQVEPGRSFTAPFELLPAGDRALLPDDVEDAYPLATLQLGMLYHMEQRPEEPLYHNVDSWHLRCRFVAAAFRAAVAAVVARHPLLRTSFHLTGYSLPLQLVHRQALLPIVVEDLRGLATAEQERWVDELIRREKRRHFDFVQAPQTRFHVALRSPETFQFTLIENHAIFDGWSMHSTLAEIFAAYQELLAGRQPALRPPLQLTYRDFVALERQALASPEAEAFWACRLDGCTPTELPRWPVPPEPSDLRMRSLQTRVPDELYRGLRRLASQSAVPLKSATLAAHLRVVSLLAGSSDVVTGMAANGRLEQADGDEVRGLFLNTLPLRFRLAAGSWGELVRDVFAEERALLPFRRYPLAALQRRWRDHELFEIAFNYIHFHVVRELVSSGEIEVLSARGSEGTNFKLLAHFEQDPRAQGMVLELEYDSRQVPRAQALAVSGLYLRALDEMTARPAARHGDACLLSPAELHALLHEWNDSSTGQAPPPDVVGLFAEWVARTPEATAVRAGETRLTYAELGGEVHRLARRLRRLGVTAEVRVAVCLDRSPELLVAVLAVLAAGGAYVPLDPSHPRQRLAAVMRDALDPAVYLVIGRPDLADRLALPPQAVLVPLGAGRDATAAPGFPAPPGRPHPESLAYVIYTSGSTGAPKGIGVAHRGLANYLAFCRTAYGLAPGRTVPLCSSVAFDLSVTSLLAPLAAGATVLVLPEGADGVEALAEAWRGGERLDLVKLTPSHLRAFAHLAAPPEAPGGGVLVLGGEALAAEAVEPWRQRGWRVVNEYGPTEAIVGCTVATFGPRSPASGPVAIGRPIDNARVLVLDGAGQPVPRGTAGELCAGGAALARGYLGQPQLTAERFVPDPFPLRAGDRLYRTGDLARHGLDGQLEYLGRADSQIKLRSHRIEQGEVEAALGRLPGVREAAVTLVRDAQGEPRLAAYVVAEPEARDAREIRRRLAETLPEPMVPTTVVFLDRLPVTAAGKIDRRDLAARLLDDDAGPQTAAFVAPRGPRETLLAEVWQSLLRRERVGVHDNFFALGGDSILCLQVASRARQAGLRLTSRQVFAHPTIAELAALAEELPAAVVAAAATVPGTAAAAVPLTPIQRWFFELDLPRRELFNQAVLLDVGPLPVPRRQQAIWLGRAIARLQAHHGALSYRFEPAPDQAAGWRQLRREAGDGARPSQLMQVDLSRLPEARRPEARAVAAARLHAGLDLTAGPLLRATLFDLGPSAAPQLLLILHHLIVDGVSWRILLEDLEALGGQPDPATAAPLSEALPFQSWAERLAEHARGPAALAEAGYWLRLAARPGGFAPLPVDHPGAAADTLATASSVLVSLSRDETRELLQDVPGAFRTRIDDALLAGLARALTDWTGRPLHLVELEGHGREEITADLDPSRTVGWCTALYPVALDLAGADGAAAALKAIKEQLRAVPGRGLAYGVVRYLGDGEAARQLRAFPRAEVLFNYLGQLDAPGGTGLDGAAAPRRFRPRGGAGPVRSGRQPLSYRLEIEAAIHDGRLHLSVLYGARRYERATIEALAAAFAGSLRDLIALCRSPGAGGFTPSDFPLAGLDQHRLDALAGALGGELEDLYPASPVQQGMLFHTLEAARPGTYVHQLSVTLTGDLDAPAFTRAWAAVAARHAVLRTAFLWQGLDEPLQAVLRSAALPWDRQDWRGMTEPEQQRRLRPWLDADRRRGFELAASPLLRLALFRRGDDRNQFVLTVHHLILDGWSMPLLLGELFALYESCRRGEAAQLAPARPYRDYIAWLRAQDPGAHREYWRGTLAGFTAPTLLGYDAGPAAPAARAELAGALELHLPAAAAERLRAFARSRRLTLNTLAQAAWALVLARCGGARDVLFGVTTSGRSAPLPGIESMIGLFINTLPVRVEVDPAAPLDGWLAAVHRRQLEMLQHEAAPLGEVHGYSEVPHGQPLFESLLVFENYPVDETLRERTGAALAIGGWTASEQTNYPLAVVVSPAAAWLGLQIVFDRGRFDDASVRRLLGHLRMALEALPRLAAARVGDVEILDAAERTQLLAWAIGAPGAMGQPAEAADDLARRFADQAARTPHHPAVISGDETLTYAQLAERAWRLAHHLRAAGVDVGVPVALLMKSSAAAMVAIQAVLAAGGSWLPLAPDHPAERLAFMVEGVGARVVIAESRGSGPLPAFHAGTRVIVLDEEADAIAARPASYPAVDIPPAALAYTIYTSGSTGLPKGVMCAHRGAVQLLAAMAGLEPRLRGEPLRATLNAPLIFDASVQQLVMLLAGHTLCLVPAEVRTDPPAMVAWLRRQRVDLLDCTPSLLRALVAEGLLDGDQHPAVVFAAGEAIDDSLWQALRAAAGRRLYNIYGPTECSVSATGLLIAAAAGGPGIGKPLAGYQAYVLAGDQRPAPLGAAGELCLGGSGLARGYVGRPDLTAERFVPHPFASAPGQRLYRTGDLARVRPGGELEFLGRADRQLKLRGYRIEPDEIEAALRLHPWVGEAAVAARRLDGAGGEWVLLAWVQPAAGAPATAAELTAGLRRHLRARLPAYMLPAAILPLAALPRTPGGKLDRRQLAAPARDGSPPGRAARDGIEGLVATIFSQVLGVAAVDPEASFLELGGHSLLATRLLSRLRAAFGVELAMAALFAAPTVAALAVEIAAALAAGGGAAADGAPLAPAPRTGPLPLSFAQWRLWLADQLEPGNPAYNVPVALRLVGPLDTGALTASLSEIVRRHEILRTRFGVAAGEPVQWPLPHRSLALPVVDLRALGAPRREAEQRRLERQEALRPFSLEAGRPHRQTLLRLAPDANLLLITLHHIVCDGWSMAVLTGDLAALYAAGAAGRPVPLEEPRIQYADFAVWQRQRLRGELLDRLLAWWQQRLAGAPPLLELPGAHRRAGYGPSRGGSRLRWLEAPLVQAIETLGKRESCTLFMTLFAAFSALLHAETGALDLVVGTDVAQRDRAEIEPLVGFFVNQLALRADLAGNPSFRDLLARARDMALAAYTHQELPFDLLVAALGVARSAGRAPVFQVKLGLINLPRQVQILPGLEITRLEPEVSTPHLDLNLRVYPAADRLALSLEYDAALYDPAAVDRLLALFEEVLSQVTADPGMRLDRLVAALRQADHGRGEERERRLREGRRGRLLQLQEQATGHRP